jgi:hypothetical protein
VGADTLPARPVHDSVDDLLAGAVRLGEFRPVDARSPATFERVLVDGQRCVVKYVHFEHDFALRAIADAGCLTRRAWELGLMDSAPANIDHATMGMARWGDDGWGCAVLMRDVTDELIPPGDSLLTEEQHLGFLNDLAALSASNWDLRDRHDLLSASRYWEFFGTRVIEAEERLGFPEPVPRIAQDGWQRFTERVPVALADAVHALRSDASPLVHAISDTPFTLLHGDWKLGNLGRGRDGRTVLIDWAYVGVGPVTHELAWYLALNRARLPRGTTKELTISSFAAALSTAGVDRTGWWERQLAVCLLGALVQFGWEKALGPDDELQWWCERAGEGLELL